MNTSPTLVRLSAGVHENGSSPPRAEETIQGPRPPDASTDVTTPPQDGSADTTVLGDSGPDANVGATASDSGPDARDSSPTDVNDGAITDANDGSTDAPDASTPITCTPLPTVGNIYYSRQGIFPDGGPKTDGEIWIVKGDGSSDAMIGLGEHPRLSPDGKHILFFRDAVNYYAANLYVRDLPVDGGAPLDHLVFTNQNAIGGFDWRPDSLWFVFDYKDDIYSANIDGSSMQKVITYLDDSGYTDYPVINRNDGRIAWHNFYDGIGISSANGSNAAHVPNTYAGAKLPKGTGVLPAADMFPAWSSDGAWLAFLRIPPVNDYVPGSIGTPYKIQPDGGARTYLTPGLNPGDGFFGGGVITADGTLYITAGLYLGVQDMYAVPLDGSGGIKRVCTTPGAPIDFVGTALYSGSQRHGT